MRQACLGTQDAKDFWQVALRKYSWRQARVVSSGTVLFRRKVVLAGSMSSSNAGMSKTVKKSCDMELNNPCDSRNI